MNGREAPESGLRLKVAYCAEAADTPVPIRTVLTFSVPRSSPGSGRQFLCQAILVLDVVGYSGAEEERLARDTQPRLLPGTAAPGSLNAQAEINDRRSL